MFDYNLNQIKIKLIEAGLKEGDTIYCHSNLGFFGIPEKNFNEINLAKAYFDAINDVVGESGTLIFPTYTYGLSNNQISENNNKETENFFDINETKSKMGILAEYARTLPSSIRTKDPFYSSVVYGKLKYFFT